jgi:maleylacetate reductase
MHTNYDEAFVYNGVPNRVVFGSGTIARLAEEIKRLGLQRPIVLSTPVQKREAEEIAAQLGKSVAGVFSNATMHTPTDVTDQAVAVVTESKADGVISFGGGSTTGLGKAIALRTDLPQIVLPTTYAGSEMTNILGETYGGEKKTLRSPKVQPEVVIYDVDFTLTLPKGLSATSGMNAIAHSAEGLYAQDRNPIVSLMALEGIRAIVEGLPVIMERPQDRTARSKALYGAWLSGTVLNSVGMALHHKLCHVLGGTFDLPHAETHTVVLPHVISFNAQAVGELLGPVAEILQSAGPGQGLYDFAKRIGAPIALKDIGMPADGLDRAATLATENPYYNPRKFDRNQIRALLDDAFHGRRPER